MGRFKNEIHIINNKLIQYLINGGYKHVNNISEDDVYTKVYASDIYYIRISFNFTNKKIYISKEDSSGRLIEDSEIVIRDSWLEDEEVFIDEVDYKLKHWIG